MLMGPTKHSSTTTNVDDNFIENGTILATPTNLRIMLEDPKRPFGHGYCVAMALQDLDLPSIEWFDNNIML